MKSVLFYTENHEKKKSIIAFCDKKNLVYYYEFSLNR